MVKNSPTPQIIVVTPTLMRPLRWFYIQRCLKTFENIKNLFWLLIEDDEKCDPLIGHLLKESNIQCLYSHYGPTRDWGTSQRNFALNYIKEKHLEGIVYLADDDNGYRTALFREIRKTEKLSIFPVACLGPNFIERPIVKNHRIVGWDAGWLERKYPVDWAGIAFHSHLLNGIQEPLLKGINWIRTVEKNPQYKHMSDDERKRFLRNHKDGETEFLLKLIRSSEEFELLGSECKKCYVVHNLPIKTNCWFTIQRCYVKLWLNKFIKWFRLAEVKLGVSRFIRKNSESYYRIRFYLKKSNYASEDITVIYPFRNRLDNKIVNSLKSIRSQDYDQKLIKILIIDYNSMTAVKRPLADLGKKYAAEIIRVEGVREWNRAHCFNIGIKNTASKYLLCADVDIIFSKNYLSEGLKQLSLNPMQIVLNNCQDLDSCTPCAKFEMSAMEQLKVSAKRRFETRLSYGINLGATFFYHTVRGYDEGYKIWGLEDDDLLRRFANLGLQFRIIDVCYYFHQYHPKFEGLQEYPDLKETIEKNQRRYNQKFGNSLKRLFLKRTNGLNWGQATSPFNDV